MSVVAPLMTVGRPPHFPPRHQVTGNISFLNFGLRRAGLGAAVFGIVLAIQLVVRLVSPDDSSCQNIWGLAGKEPRGPQSEVPDPVQSPVLHTGLNK